jgi:hypothetical protein
LIGGSSCVATLADAFADVEGDAASGPFHLIAKVGLAPGELGDDAADFAIELQRAAIDIELVEVILASCVDRLSSFGSGYRRVERKGCSMSDRGDRQIGRNRQSMPMSLGRTPKSEDLFRSSRDVCEQWLSEDSIYRILHREGCRLFPDEAFADLFAKRGRHCVAPQIVAVVMVLQRIEGLSDREAVERCRFDLRWKYAAGGLDFDYSSFVHTVLVGMRARLRNSDRPDRIFEAVLQVAKQARHGHKTSARGFDGYKGHIALDPDSEIITATEVTAANAGDAEPAESLLDDMLDEDEGIREPAVPSQPVGGDADAQDMKRSPPPKREVYGGASYGTAAIVERLESADSAPYVKVQPPSMRDGKFAQDKFNIDLEAATVRCPAGQTVELRPQQGGSSHAIFAPYCSDCPLRDACTASKHGRTINVHPKHETLHRARQEQSDPEWNNRYQHTRPKVERKLAHMMRRRHGGRRARVRGRVRVGHDFALLAAAVNLQRLAALGVSSFGGQQQGTAAPVLLAHG